MIIAFSGVDCAGKSTQIELLRQHYLSRGMTCTVFWYRPGYSRELECCKSLARNVYSGVRGLKRRLSGNSADSASEGGTGEMRASGKRLIPPVWMVTALVDSALQYALKLRLLARKYDVVICDRYVCDGKLDIVFKYPEMFWPETIFEMISGLFPKPDVSFLLWLDYETCKARAEAKHEPFPDDDRTRYLRWRAYDFLRDDGCMCVIDTRVSVEEAHHRILENL